MDQAELNRRNREAWDARAYDAWTSQWGSPAAAAAEVVKAPEHKVRRFLPHLGSVHGKRIANPLGSNGRLATAFALLGAEVTVFDISSSNKRFALELARHAGVRIEFIVGDFLSLPVERYRNQFDCAVLELGILHYFADLQAPVEILHGIVKAGGRVVLNEFHPLLNKALVVKDGKVELKGDYFSADFVEADVAYQSILEDASLPKCLLRRWTLGEIVTAFAHSPFKVKALEELPDWDCKSLPGMFTLVAEK